MARLMTATGMLALASLGDAVAFPGASTGAGFIHVPINKAPLGSAPSTLRRRATANTANLNMPNAQVYGYMLNISLGTPGQNTMVSLDTGSIELWVNPNCTGGDMYAGAGLSTNGVPNAQSEKDYCKTISQYNKGKSSTAKSAGIDSTTFRYGDGAFADIDYVKDSLEIAGVTVKDQVFGVATDSNYTATGIMGIGPWQSGFNTNSPYELMLSSMVSQGAIKSRAFSLNLGDFDEKAGSLIFGGVDKSKYAGELYKIPLQNQTYKFDNGQTSESSAYYVKATSMSLTKPNATSSTDLPMPSGQSSIVADLDCGAGAMLLHEGVVKKVCTELGSTYTSSSGSCEMTKELCDYRSQTGGVTFGFDGGASLQATWDNLLLPVKQGDGSTWCNLGMVTSNLDTDPATYLIGAPFLRSVYSVFDWDNQNVHLAQVANCGEDISAIGTGSNSVPSGKGNCDTKSTSKKASGAGVTTPNVGMLVAMVGGGLLAMLY